ncbi:cof-like hydrolase [Jeotgalibacillus alimentarius]|uniref:Cof-like hydrolase n=1 Tax=Jeotgalibacillus alimentarius TaxID=135826 RepID=A0A0C2RKH9_9BACL|nr:Cof-type HAD-IIB family hydrolase [Jeotgalibacillus alimentarius]KIL50710.1 cof-like hydrolase [Jeotgalibacillus alimentarius]
MEKSIIFFDIDGTLLNHDKKLPASTKEAISRLQQLGHEVAIATGRAPFMYENLRKELGIRSFISYNGQYVVLNDEVIYKNPLTAEALEKLTAVAVENEHPVVYMDHEDMKANVRQHAYIEESIGTLKIGMEPTHDPDYHVDRPLYQSLLFCEKGEEEQYRETFPDFDFIRWHTYSVDILPKGGSKAQGIAKMIEKLGYPAERQFAFGDGLNDIEMLTAVENSFAMGNAFDKVKASAKFVTKSVEENGILHGLQMAGLLD